MNWLRDFFVVKKITKLSIHKQTLLVRNFSTKKCIDNNEKENKVKKNEKKFTNRLKSTGDIRQKKCNFTVTIVGGGFSTACATVLLKQNPAIKDIRIVDTDDSLAGYVCDARHIDTCTNIRHYKKQLLFEGLRDCDIVALMDETDFTLGSQGPFTQLTWSANYVKSIAEIMINACPRALVAVFARPITGTVPLICEVFKNSYNYDPNRIIGSAALETMRIAAITADFLHLDQANFVIPMAGGVDSLTTVPLLSRTSPFNDFSPVKHYELVDQLRSVERQLCESETKGPTLSSGVAAAKFISTLVNGLNGQSISITNAFVRSDATPGCKYSTSQVKFGPKGVEKNYGLPKILSHEIELIENAVPMINRIEQVAKYFVNGGTV